MLTTFAENLKSVAIIVSFLLVFGLLSLVAIEAIWPKSEIEILAVPDSLQKRGYTSDVLAQRMSDGTKEIAKKSTREFNVAYPRNGIETSNKEIDAKIPNKEIDAKIPGSDFTIRTAARFIRSLLGAPSEQITGEVTQTGNDFQLTLRYKEKETHAAITSGDEISRLVADGAALALRLANPYVLAAKLYNDEKTSAPATFVKTLEILDEMISASKYHLADASKALYYAHTLKCDVMTNLANLGLAESECGEAIKLDKTNWPARLNLGRLYARQIPVSRGTYQTTPQGKVFCEKADQAFKIVDKTRVLDDRDYGEWITCLKALGRSDIDIKAIEKRAANATKAAAQ